MSQPLLEVRGLTVAHGEAAVLRDITFTLGAGRTLGLIGESGAGKSMLGRVLAGRMPDSFSITAGQILFGGVDLATLSKDGRRELLGRRIAVVPQEPSSALNPTLTIESHFAEHLERLGVPKAGRRPATLQALAEVSLPSPEDILSKYPFQLSGGMCQRVLLALAFISKPDLVIADEPTASLDPGSQMHILRLLRRMQDRHGACVLFITHQLRLAAHICDDVAVLYSGEFIEHGRAEEVLQRPRHPYTRLLERANPVFSGPWRQLFSAPGQMPGLADLNGLQGCRYQPRCASALGRCAQAVPPLRTVAAEASIRCLLDDAAPAHEDEQGLSPPAPPAADAKPLLQVRNLSKSFNAGGLLRPGARKMAVAEVSFDIAAGEFVGLVGESGSGKSTIGRMVMGLERPTAGSIALEGRPLGHGGADWRRRIGAIQLIFQDPRSALNPRRRVFSLVTQPMQASAHFRRDQINQAELVLQDVGLPADLMKRFPRQMSGGQRQRVNIARAVSASPRLLIADEITSGLDVSVQAQILNLLLRLRQEYNIALLMVSHDLAAVRYLCTKVIVMRGGEMVESGPTDQVFANPQHPYTRQLIAAASTDGLQTAV